jgi:Ankyrin repeats (many copies)
MTASKSLPARPSLESLRKQAKKLARDIAAGDAGSIARARVQLPNVDLPLTQRNAQLVLAREYGYAGWQDLTAEVSKRLGTGLQWAAAQARRAIHDNDVERLKRLLAEYPALLSWQGNENDGGLLGIATGSYGDSFDPNREQIFTRAACAELLIDAGAVVQPSVCEGLLRSRARELLELFRRKGLLPGTLKFHAALGDIDAVRTALDENGNDLAAVTEAFTIACGFEHEPVASLLLERCIALDPELGAHIDGSVGRHAFLSYFIENRPGHATAVGLWKGFVMEQVSRAVSSWSGHSTSVTPPIGDSDLTAFVRLFQREPWLLGEAFVEFQADIIGAATLKDRREFITVLFDLEPAILRRQPPPPSQAIEFAFTYVRTHLIPLLTRIWPLPDDLPHAAGMGNLPRVKQWFDESGAPALGDVENHYPCSPYMPKGRVDEYAQQWGAQRDQGVLDVAFAWSVMNSHFDVADFLLDHGADINTTWSSHEPASILHELVFHGNYEAMRFLIDRGIDMAIKDYRWNATAQGWARHAAKDEKMAQWLEEAERQREQRPR